MPLIVDGVEIPIEAQADAASFAKATKAIQDLGKAQESHISKMKRLMGDYGDEERKRLDKQIDLQKKADAAAVKAQENYRRALNQTRESAEKLQQISMTLGVMGSAILAPMILAAKKFADSAEEGDTVAKSWQQSMSSLDISSNRAGRVIAQELNPALQATAQLVGQMTTALERNPGLADAALAVGGGLVSLAALGSIVATVEKTVANLKLVTTGSSALGKAGQAIVPVAMMAISAEVGAALGLAIANAITGKNYSLGDVVKTIALTFPAIAVESGAKAEPFKKVSDLIDKILLKIPGLAPNELRSLGKEGQFIPPASLAGPGPVRSEGAIEGDNPAVRAARKLSAEFAKEQEAALKSVKDAQTKINETVATSAQRQLEIVKRYEQERANVLRNLERDNADALRKYQEARRSATEQTERDIEKIRTDSAKRLRQIEKDHGQRTYDLLAERDALGLVKENKDYQDKKQTEQENTNEEIAQRRADLRTKLNDLARAYQNELKLNREAANARLKQLAQERDEAIKLERQKQAAINAEMVKGLDALIQAIRDRLGNVPGLPKAPSTGTGTGTGPSQKRSFAGDFSTAADIRNLGAAGSLTGSGAGMTVNINLASGTISQFRQIVAQTKAELTREFIGALETA